MLTVYTPKLKPFLVAAVQRKYESLRRAWKLDEDEASKELEAQRGKQKKYRARKRRVSCFFLPSYNYAYMLCGISLTHSQKFENRTLVVTEAEMPRWKQLGIEYMSDEYDDDDPQVVIVHSPPWRSKCELYTVCSRSSIHV